MQQPKFHTSGLHAFKLTPFMGNELVCKLATYRWNGDGWRFESLEAVYFKDTQAKETYINKLIKEYNHD